MESHENLDEEFIGQEKEIPLCLKCLQPVNPLFHYCPNCGEAVGQLTPYIPFVNIQWQTRIWGRMWRQLWSRKISFAGKLFRLFMIIWNVPVMLIGIIPILWHKRLKTKDDNINESQQTN